MLVLQCHALHRSRNKRLPVLWLANSTVVQLAARAKVPSGEFVVVFDGNTCQSPFSKVAQIRHQGLIESHEQGSSGMVGFWIREVCCPKDSEGGFATTSRA